MKLNYKGIACGASLLLSPLSLIFVTTHVQAADSKEYTQLAFHGGGHGGGRGWHGGGRGWHGGGRGWNAGGARVWRGNARGWHGRGVYAPGWRGGVWRGGWVGGVWYGPGAYPSYYNVGCRSVQVFQKVCKPKCYWSNRYQAERCTTRCYSAPTWVRRCW